MNPRRLILLLFCALSIAACGEKSEPKGVSGERDSLSLMLDYTPNVDHAGIYAAKASGAFTKAGLNVKLRTPPSPSSPLPLLAAGKVDLAISYEPELLLARQKDPDLVAVAALIRAPLTSLMSLGDTNIKKISDLRGKTVGTAGIPYQDAYLKTLLASAGVPSSSVKKVNVGFNLVPAMISGRVDATLGAFWNIEGVDLQKRRKNPSIIHVEKFGVPTYDELILVARRKDLNQDFAPKLRRFLQALAIAHTQLRSDPTLGVDALSKAEHGLDHNTLMSQVSSTMPAYFPEDKTKPFGYMDRKDWDAYGKWMFKNHLVKQDPGAAGALTDEFLPGQQLQPGKDGEN